MKSLWQVTSARVVLLFVALGVLLADADDRNYGVHVHPTSKAAD